MIKKIILTEQETIDIWNELRVMYPNERQFKQPSEMMVKSDEVRSKIASRVVISNKGNLVCKNAAMAEWYIDGTNPDTFGHVAVPSFDMIEASGSTVYEINTRSTYILYYLLILKKHPAMAEDTQEKQTTKEFVIDVKNIDIKKEIKHAVIDFSKIYVEANLERALDSIVQEAVKKLTPNYVKVGERKEIKIEGRLHKAYKESLFLCQHERQLFISGPAGSGKTTLGEQIAQSLGLKFYHISCSAGLSEAHLLGRMLFDGSYVSSDFVKAYEEGGIFLFDEIDAADANTLLILNSGLANGMISVPNRKGKTTAKRHKDFICIAAANTWGHGSFEYHGRNHLDAAFLDRFAMSKVQVDYDKQLEKDIAASQPDLATELWKVRQNCEKNKVRKVVSTRAFISGVRQMAAGKSLEEVLDRFFIGWTKEERAKALAEDPNKVATPQPV